MSGVFRARPCQTLPPGSECRAVPSCQGWYPSPCSRMWQMSVLSYTASFCHDGSSGFQTGSSTHDIEYCEPDKTSLLAETAATTKFPAVVSLFPSDWCCVSLQPEYETCKLRKA
jgi:hypothetical protein